jgi:hypothetical protein
LGSCRIDIWFSSVVYPDGVEIDSGSMGMECGVRGIPS